jgi:ABC-type glycerol-3-phosphate transport system permease component
MIRRLIFRRIVLPLCKPALALLAIITILWRWNDVLWPLLAGLRQRLVHGYAGLAIAGLSQGIYTGVPLATAVMAILPVMIIYLLLQRHIICGIAASGMKA